MNTVLAQTPPLIADPCILQIPVIDNHDPFIDVKTEGKIVYGPSPEIPDNQDYTKMRRAVYLRLLQAQQLLPIGLRICLYEAYRSLDLQKFLFDNRYAKVKKQHANWLHHQVFTETTRLVSPVINLDGSQNIPPHSTGGAIDVYLIDDKGDYVEMGLHPKDWMEDNDGSLSETNSQRISEEAKQNRKMMSEALSTAGFVNYPTEYWHWSYGDRYWAYHADEPHAIYSCY